MNWMLIDSWLSHNPLLADYFSVLLLFLNNAGIVPVPTGIKDAHRNIGSSNRCDQHQGSSLAVVHVSPVRPDKSRMGNHEPKCSADLANAARATA